ncbi:protein-glutamate methylesterase/protein-glutamine glutaminase [Cellulomonas cellasea]|uniref:Protein-glutamate methylesterase/protein-glutamine glutaminase n=1 Tax=Cellulomonas cellasea TaxID=43670 RepID=A0A4Y3L0F3_9CELL|nr:chemotaxis response regulator protein-glutamate methylesterase [Cellulomonas cellasea]GEA89853.1 chemotaxis response regulator protein-glutamate methylesterase of group 2 operon [Cellulomonas cellasea]
MSRIRVLVVDDSVVVRRLVTDTLAGDPAIDVVGTAANGQIALTKVEQLAPDLVTMDIEMPVMDGIGAVRALRASGSRVPIIMFSTLTERGASATLDALAAGATDYVTKPANVGSVSESLATVARELIPRIKALVPNRGHVGALATPAAGSGSGAAAPALRPLGARTVTLRPAPRPRPLRAIVVGSSTGGPEALSRVFSALSSPLPVPVLVVQHMPPVFTRQLAARLDRATGGTVVEASGGEELRPGHVYVAPGDHHLELQRSASGARTVLTQGPPVNFCRPAVDVLFRSAVTVYGGDLLAVVLTGMGSDGRAGCEDVVAAGGTVYAQDERSSVVWGMPGAVATAGLAHRVLPLDQVAHTLVGAVQHATGAPAARASGGAA